MITAPKKGTINLQCLPKLAVKTWRNAAIKLQFWYQCL